MQTPDVVIATPERLLQLLSRDALNLSTVSYVVSRDLEVPLLISLLDSDFLRAFLTFLVVEEADFSCAFCLQVVDGLDELINGGCQEQLKSIREQLQKGVQIGIISKSFPAEVVSATGNWLQHPIVRAATDKSVPASSVCITQSVSVVTTEEAKLSKVIL